MLEGKKTGRLIEYDPKTKAAKVLIKDLYFGNGVAVSKNGDFVIINITFDKKIFRYWLSGPKKGTQDVFVDTLPGFIDGVSLGSNGTFWVAMLSHDQDAAAGIISKLPGAKTLIAKFFVQQIHALSKEFGAVMQFDENGQIIRGLYDPSAEHIKGITSVTEHGGKLYLGSFNDYIGVKDLMTKKS
jgi:hypothetical protein